MDLKDKAIAILGMAVLLTISHGLVAWKAYNVGVDMNAASTTLKTGQANDVKIDIKEKQDEIINNRPTVQRTIDRMRGETL